MAADQVTSVTIQGKNINGILKDGRDFKTFAADDPDLVKLMRQHRVKVQAKPDDDSGIWQSIFVSWFPMLLLIGVWIFFMRQMQAGGGKALAFGKSRARMANGRENKVTFQDVAGIEEAKIELEEIIEFLKDAKRFTKLGGRIPKGVLLVGQPGTGKTLLARAIAGEANVPFFSISGSDFVEMFVGVGASRVRDLFNQGKKNAPCIIFIDEIDAVGRHRGAGLGGGHDEREQTLNQLLVEMDGFESNGGVIVISATNRPDVLDPALLRPGRFDRQIVVPIPDVKGREEILGVHTRKTVLAQSIDLSVIARGTPGFSGADLANLVNEAALIAARQNKKEIEIADLEEAKDKVLMGVERQQHDHPLSGKEKCGLPRGGACARRKDDRRTRTPSTRLRSYRAAARSASRSSLPIDERHTYSKEYLTDNVTILSRRKGRGRDRPQPPDDRGGQRHRAGHGDRQEDDLRMGHERKTRPPQLRQERGTGLPRQRDAAPEGFQREALRTISTRSLRASYRPASRRRRPSLLKTSTPCTPSPRPFSTRKCSTGRK